MLFSFLSFSKSVLFYFSIRKYKVDVIICSRLKWWQVHPLALGTQSDYLHVQKFSLLCFYCSLPLTDWNQDVRCLSFSFSPFSIYYIQVLFVNNVHSKAFCPLSTLSFLTRPKITISSVSLSLNTAWSWVGHLFVQWPVGSLTGAPPVLPLQQNQRPRDPETWPRTRDTRGESPPTGDSPLWLLISFQHISL